MQLATRQLERGETMRDLELLWRDINRESITLPLSRLHVSSEDGTVDIDAGKSWSLTEVSARQLSSFLRIPPRFTLQSPNEMAAHALNYQLALHDENATILLEGNKITGIITDRYEPTDPGFLISELGAHLEQHNDQQLTGWYRDDNGFGVRLTLESQAIEPRVGDVVRAGVDMLVRENSGIGIGVRGVIMRLVCTNGAVIPESAGLRRHLRKESWRDQATRTAMAIEEFGDVIQQTRSFMDELPMLTQTPLELPLADDDGVRSSLIRGSLRVVGLPAVYTDSVSDALRTEEPSLFGYYNAVTRLGRDARLPDVRARFERAGTRTITRRETLAEVFTQPVEA